MYCAMNFLVLVFVSLVVGSFSHEKFPSDDFEKSLSRRQRSFWEDVVNEISDDISRGSSCVSAVETFIEENPEVLLVAKRSVSDHRLTRRGIKKWLNKLNPIKYFYDCAMFLKDKGVEIYNFIKTAVNDPDRIKNEISEGIEETAKMLSKTYVDSLEQMIHSVGKIASYLDKAENVDTELNERILYKTISNVQSNLKSYALNLKQKDTENIFLDTMKVFPRIGNSLRKLNWDLLSSFELSFPRSEAILFAKGIKKFNLGGNVMLIMKHAKKLSPEFEAAEEQQLSDLGRGIVCVSFLLKSTYISRIENTMDDIGKLEYLHEAKRCGSFVTEYTDDEQSSSEKASKLTAAFLEAVSKTVRFLQQLEDYLYKVEGSVNELSEEEKILMKAVKQIKHYLISGVEDKAKEFLMKNFHDVTIALTKVEEITSDWSLLTKNKSSDESNEVAPFVVGSYFRRIVDLLNEFAVIPTANVAQSFLNLYTLAKLDQPSLLPFVL